MQEARFSHVCVTLSKVIRSDSDSNVQLWNIPCYHNLICLETKELYSEIPHNIRIFTIYIHK